MTKADQGQRCPALALPMLLQKFEGKVRLPAFPIQHREWVDAALPENPGKYPEQFRSSLC